jgi:hypothetical protein
MEKIKDLLNSYSQIRIKHNDYLKETGSGFNIFSVLGLSTNEVRTHSALIAELLNSKGSHSQGNQFLVLLLETLKIDDFDIGKYIVKCPFWIGPLNQEKTEGGQIDLLLEDENNSRIIIENKIFAQDQVNQLLRYANFDKSAKIIYLTLNGTEPSNLDKKSKIEYLSISYKKEINIWLNKCLKETENIPYIKFIIEHYINLIKQLTEKKENPMKKEVYNLLSENPSLINVANQLSKDLNDIKNEIQIECSNILQKKWGEIFLAESEVINCTLFIYKEYEICARISDELGRFHLDIFPAKKMFSHANDKEIEFIKKIAYQVSNSVQDKNYLLWMYFKKDLDNLKPEEYIKLYENNSREKWANDIMKECKDTIRSFIENLNKIPINPAEIEFKLNFDALV